MANVKIMVTVQAVRAANGKMMSASKDSPSPAPPSPRLALTLRDVATGGQLAMQLSLKKA